MKKPFSNINFKWLFLSLCICCIVAGLIALLAPINFWIVLPIVVAAMWINGWIAELEDRGDR
ncbi:hypothetical protein ABHF33_10910 [Chitinibacter sp. FCG-7]|uniref:Uncharacterized protein n=1 Tax=Chitinibacter mangrovi TaxID=3153927 RepID=A0AAU7F4Z1_9NEIS